MSIAPRPHVAAMAAYPLPDVGRGGEEPPISLAQNESFQPPSLAAQSAAQAALANGQLYADPGWNRLRAAIARQHGLDPATLLCGAGSMDLIAALAQAYLGPGTAALIPAQGYLFFRTATQLSGARVDLAPEVDFAVDHQALLRALQPDSKILFVADPANPTGTFKGAAWLRQLRTALPEDLLLVIDQAYGEFVDPQESDLFDLVQRGDTVILRTFSKAYGLAGLRCGWGCFPSAFAQEVAKFLFGGNPSGPSQAAATAAMDDQASMRALVAETGKRRQILTQRLRGLGITVPESHTNFLLLVFPDASVAALADQRLREAGLVLRPMASYDLPQALRLTIGPEPALDRVVAILEDLRAEGAWS
ncbi:MAG: histidinol-phosphate transaminase [Pseudomonadota bacterium]